MLQVSLIVRKLARMPDMSRIAYKKSRQTTGIMLLNTFSPYSAPRRILLLVSGMSPQIVTETVYALSQVQAQPFLPTEIHLITTSQGAEQARLNLLAGPRHFHQLCRDYGLDESTFTAERIHVIRDTEGRMLTDIRTPDENEATADFIASKVREMTVDPNTALHVSMAGGRKTMGYYAGYALSLFGRPQDRLSHVLVSEGYEGLPEFYYPTPTTHTIRTRNGLALDAAKAEVSLAEIPFVRLRAGLPSSLLSGAHSFSKTVELAGKASGRARLELMPSKKTYRLNGELGKLTPVHMALLLWVASREGKPVAPLVEGENSHEYATELLAVIDKYHVSLHGKTEDSLQKDGITKAFLETTKSKLNAVLNDQLGPELAALCKLVNVTRHGKSGYALPEETDIEIKD